MSSHDVSSYFEDYDMDEDFGEKANLSLLNEEWLDIRYIGNYWKHSVKPPEPRTNLVYTPSGIIGAYIIRIPQKNNNTFQRRNRDCPHLIMFIDLVNKVCYEMKIKELQVTSFYFSSEDELVVVVTDNEIVKQVVYSVNYSNHSLKLKERIVHQFVIPEYTLAGSEFPLQSTKFVCLDGIDYLLLIDDNNDVEHYLIYLAPKYPSQYNEATKEFQVYIGDEIERMRIKSQLLIEATHGHKYNGNWLDVSSSLVCGTTLWISFKITALNDNVRSSVIQGTLVGAYCTIDLAKLKDLSHRKVETDAEIEKLKQEQEFDRDIGLVSALKNNEDCRKETSVALLYPSNLDSIDTAKILDCKFSNETDPGYEVRYTLHTHGALLELAFGSNTSVYLRVIKSLRMNLKSLAFNRALFHKDTPIRNHPAYRICFNGTKPIEYSNYKDDK